MGKVTRSFDLRVMVAGSTSTVDFTIPLSNFASLPRSGGQLVRLESGQAPSQAFDFDIVDASEIVTSRLGDASGRLQLLGRVVEYRESTNGSALAPVFVGRLSALTERTPGIWTLTVSDERWFERRQDYFDVADTTRLYPAGPIYQFRSVGLTAGLCTGKVVEKDANYVHWVLRNGGGLPAVTADWIRANAIADVDTLRTDGSGNFQHLRFLQGSNVFEIVQFGESLGGALDEGLDAISPRSSEIHFWTAQPSSPYTVGAEFSDCQLSNVGGAPSTATPLHVGVKDTSHSLGYAGNVWQFVKDRYDDFGIRYDATQFAALIADPIYPRMEWRLTEQPSEGFGEWLEDHVYGPMGVVPFINDQGEISPRSVRLPVNLDHTTLFTFDASNLAEVPSVTIADPVNQLRVEFEELLFAQYSSSIAIADFVPRGPIGGDLMVAKPQSELYEHDNVATIGRTKEVRYRMTGLPTGDEGRLIFGAILQFGFNIELGFASRRATHELFERRGDGVMKGTFVSHRRTQDASGRTPEEDVFPGDFVKLDLSIFPNPANNARGGVRIIQVTEKRPVLDGIQWTFEDAGPAVQPFATPSVAVALNSGEPRHAADITLSSVPSGATATVELGLDASGPPARVFTGKANGTFTVRGLPSGTQVRVRASAGAPNRVRSAWSAEQSVTTNALAAPTVGAETVDGYSIILPFVNNEPGYRIMPVIDGEDDLQVPLAASSDLYTFHTGQGSTSYTVGYKAVDEFGGASAAATKAVVTGATARTLVEPRRIQIKQGRTQTGFDLPPTEQWVGTGLEITWRNSELHANTLWEVSTDQSFATIEKEVQAEPGAERLKIFLPLDDQDRFARPKHRRRGFNDSPWAETVSAKPTALLATVESDSFAGAFASLHEREDDTLGASIGTTDPDTERVYYEIAKNPADEDAYPTVTTSSPYFDLTGASPSKGQLPWNGAIEDPGNPGNAYTTADQDLFIGTFRGWNSVSGFGQTTFDKLKIGALDPLEVMPMSFAWVPLQPSVFTTGSTRFEMVFAGGAQVTNVRVQYSYTDSLGTHAVNETGAVTARYIGPPSANQMNKPAIFSVTLTGIDGTGLEGTPVTYRFIGQESAALFATQPSGIPVEGGGLGGGPYLAFEKVDGTGSFSHPRLAGVPADAATRTGLSGSVTPNLNDGARQHWTLSGDITLAGPPDNWPTNATADLRITIDKGAHSITMGGSYTTNDSVISGGTSAVVSIFQHGSSGPLWATSVAV